MKRLFVLMALASISFLGYSQDVKVNINNQDGMAKDDCPYRINGICATEDIGGVDIEMDRNGELKFTNYNTFPVTVLWNIEYSACNGARCKDEEKTGNLVLGAEGQKIVSLCLCSYTWSVKGLIVRKLAQQ